MNLRSTGSNERISTLEFNERRMKRAGKGKGKDKQKGVFRIWFVLMVTFTCCVNTKCCSSWPPSGNLLQRPTSDVPVLGQVWEFLPVGCCDGLPGHFLQALVCPLRRHATLQLSGSSSHTYAAICPLLSSEVTAPPTGWRIKKYSNYNPKTDPEIHVLG